MMNFCRGSFVRGAPYRTLIVRFELRVCTDGDAALSPKIDHALRVIGECGLEKLMSNNVLRIGDSVNGRYSYTNVYNDWGHVYWIWKSDFRRFIARLRRRTVTWMNGTKP